VSFVFGFAVIASTAGVAAPLTVIVAALAWNTIVRHGHRTPRAPPIQSREPIVTTRPMHVSSDRRGQPHGRRRGAPPLRVGVVGAGNMGNHHARAYGSLSGLCELHGVYDVDRARAAEVGTRYETRAYEMLDAMLGDLDAVSIASPSSFHVEHTTRALEAGLHVLVEKPLAMNVEQARQIEQVAQRFPDRVVQVGHIEHFNPAIDVLRNVLADHQLIALDIQRLSPFNGRITDADVIQDLMLHDIHVALSLARSDIHRVQSAARAVHSAVQDDYAVAQLIFDDGMIASLSASRVTEEKIRRLTATTIESHVTMNYLHRTIEVCRWTKLEPFSPDDRSYRQESVVERIFVPQEEPLIAQLRSFLRCAREGGQPEVGLDMGVRCLEVIDQIRAAVIRDPRITASA
jgi:predicted dehydrogenase